MWLMTTVLENVRIKRTGKMTALEPSKIYFLLYVSLKGNILESVGNSIPLWYTLHTLQDLALVSFPAHGELWPLSPWKLRVAIWIVSENEMWAEMMCITSRQKHVQASAQHSSTLLPSSGKPQRTVLTQCWEITVVPLSTGALDWQLYGRKCSSTPPGHGAWVISGMCHL